MEDIPRPEPLVERYKKVFGEELGEQIMDVQLGWLVEWEPYRACADCGERPFMFMLKDELWAAIAPRASQGFLCIWCCEVRLGRRVVIEDLNPVGVNTQLFFGMAHRKLEE